jgi:hypothetical protein
MKEERFYVVLVVSRGVDSVSSGSSLITTRVPGTGYRQGTVSLQYHTFFSSLFSTVIANCRKARSVALGAAHD